MITKPINLPEVFPEGAAILRRLLCQNGKIIKRLENQIKDIYNNQTYTENTKEFCALAIKVFFLDPLFKDQIRHRRELALYSKTTHRLNVSSAKAVPLESLFELQKARRTSEKIHCCCPLHNDKTPSFCIYLKTNSFHCFGCHEGGDTVVFVQKLHNFSFKEAVNFLNKGQL
jgi:hypothetical protein